MQGELKVVKKEVRIIMEQRVSELSGSIDDDEDDQKKFIKCCLCTKPILERYLLKIYEKYFHETCLKCTFCLLPLKQSCFAKNGSYYCKEHYSSLFGCKCAACYLQISPNELVMKALDKVYHVECFKCIECGDKLEKGDEFIMKDSKLFCRADFNVAEQRSDVEIFSSDCESMSTTSPNNMDDKNNGSKRPRTILTSQQREGFKAAFEQTPKPCRKVREQLSNETGLSVRVVQVWFQNQRAKLKKLQRKAEDGNNNKIKKVNNAGKVSVKKKRTKSNESSPVEKIQTTEESNQLDFNLPNTTDLSGETPMTNFTNFLDINNSYPTVTSLINLPNGFYQNGENTLLANNDRMTAADLLRLNPFTRLPNALLDPTVPLLQPAFQFPVIPSVTNGVTTSANTTTSNLNFQFMPHLMNTFP